MRRSREGDAGAGRLQPATRRRFQEWAAGWRWRRDGRGKAPSAWARFLERFNEHFQANGLTLPPPESPEFYAAAVRLLRLPERLCPELNEALMAIDELSTERAISGLSARKEWRAVFGESSSSDIQAPGKLQDTGERSPADLVIELWLGNPDFVRSCYNTWRLKRLSAFEYASSGLAREQRAVFDPEDRVAMLKFTSALDSWFLQNHRGAETAKVEVYPMDGEYWYLIRHGGLYTRAPRVERQETHIIQFRPERDDVLVYSPEMDEVRVNARTKGERDLYIEQFGLHLCGDNGYFRERRTYTLEPLRHGPVALECDPVEGIERITLKAVQVERNNHLQEVVTHEATDLFQCAPSDPRSMAHFGEGMLARALFEIQFTGQLKPQAVEIRVPNTLKMSRRCNVRAVRSWLVRSGIRTAGPGLAQGCGEMTKHE